jgi:hypothetical protein
VPLPELSAPSQAEQQAPASLHALTRPGERSNYIPSDSTIRTHRQAQSADDSGMTFLEAATGRDLTSAQAINSVVGAGYGNQTAILPSALPEARASAACALM